MHESVRKVQSTAGKRMLGSRWTYLFLIVQPLVTVRSTSLPPSNASNRETEKKAFELVEEVYNRLTCVFTLPILVYQPPNVSFSLSWTVSWRLETEA